MTQLGQIARVIYQRPDGQFGCTMTAYTRLAELDFDNPVLTYSEYRQATDKAKIPEGTRITRLIIGRYLYAVDDHSLDFHVQLAETPIEPVCRLEINFSWETVGVLQNYNETPEETPAQIDI